MPREKTLRARVDESMYTQAETVAQEDGRTVSEWLRELVLAELKKRRRRAV